MIAIQSSVAGKLGIGGRLAIGLRYSATKIRLSESRLIRTHNLGRLFVIDSLLLLWRET